MAWFSHHMPRWALLTIAVGALGMLPPETFARGPNLCLWHYLFHISACPACGTTRALAAFFHGQFSQALAFNRNVVVTAPSLVALLARDLAQLAKLGMRYAK